MWDVELCKPKRSPPQLPCQESIRRHSKLQSTTTTTYLDRTCETMTSAATEGFVRRLLISPRLTKRGSCFHSSRNRPFLIYKSWRLGQLSDLQRDQEAVWHLWPGIGISLHIPSLLPNLVNQPVEGLLVPTGPKPRCDCPSGQKDLRIVEYLCTWGHLHAARPCPALSDLHEA
jgi:hypothetical protein